MNYVFEDIARRKFWPDEAANAFRKSVFVGQFGLTRADNKGAQNQTVFDLARAVTALLGCNEEASRLLQLAPKVLSPPLLAGIQHPIAPYT
jgi:hypothetical protein